MSSYNGVLYPGAEATSFLMTARAIVNWPRGTGQSEDYPEIDDTTIAKPAVWTSQHPLSMPENSLSGVRLPAYVDDYYYRFHFTPNQFIERIASDTILTSVLWNAYLDQADCTDVSWFFVNEFDVVFPSGEPPFSIWTLRTKTITLNVPVDGIPVFSDTVTFNFGTKNHAWLNIQITRLLTFIWVPQVPMLETLEWKTDIMYGADKSDEQRMATRPAPRQGVQFSVYFDDEQTLAKAKWRIHNWADRLWAMPCWWEKEWHAATISSGATSITLDTTDADWRDDSMGIIYQDEDNWEIILIDTVAPTSLTLTNSVVSTWTGGVWLLPLRGMYAVAPFRAEMQPDGHTYLHANLLCNENVLLTTYSPATTYQGLTVLTKATYVNPNVEENVETLAIRVDYGFGAFRYLSDSEFPRATQTHRFQSNSKAEAWELREFLHSLYGKRTPVFIPTFQEDLRISRNVVSSDTSIYVHNVGFHEYVGVNNLRRDVAFVFPDGTQILRRIVSTSNVDASEDTIVIDSNLGQDVDVGDCEISFLDKYRLASDEVAINWDEPRYNVCDLSFVRVQH